MKPKRFNMNSIPSVRIVPPSDEETEIRSKKISKGKKAGKLSSEKKSKALLSQEQQELVDIKNKLGLRHQDFAIMLNIGLPRLSSYTYGRTASVPEEVMTRARQLLTENGKTTMQIREKFARPMSRILEDWAKKLGTRTDAELAAILGVVGMTINRWKKNINRPDLTALNRYDHIVELISNNTKIKK